MAIASRTEQGVLVVQLRGELDHHAVEGIRDEVEEQLRVSNYSGLVVSFKNIDFMDSSALGLILGRYRTVRQHDGKMALCEVNTSLRRIFELSGLLKIMALFDSEEEAVRYAKEG